MFRNLFDGWHIVILIVLVVIIFGWKRLPDAARSLGRSARILKSEMDDMKNESKSGASGQTVKGETTTPGFDSGAEGHASQSTPNPGSSTDRSGGTGTGA